MPLLRPTRRAVALGLGALPLAPALAHANQSRELTWDDLIPQGVPYAEIVGQGHYDEVNDIWIPEFDKNGTEVVSDFDGMTVRLPGYITPLEHDADDMVRDFLFAPFMGACIHVPPPPPNQLVHVTTDGPGWPGADIFMAVWVIGTFKANVAETDLAAVGYEMRADAIEVYEW